jgi:hypothetical protein
MEHLLCGQWHLANSEADDSFPLFKAVAEAHCSGGE